MKKIKKIYFGFYIIILGLTIMSPAQASTFVFKPNVFNLTAGQTFTLPVVVDPMAERQYTVRLAISFPSDLMEVTSFVFAQNWLTLSQPGYDSLDNNKGELIKTAGFPNGFFGPVSFGDITFRAKTAGESTIVVDSPSFVLDASNVSTLESRSQVRVVVSKSFIPTSLNIEPLPDLPAGQQNLFDVNLEGFGQNGKIEATSAGLGVRVAPGEFLPTLIKLANFGNNQRVDVTITYKIFNQAGAVLVTATDTVAVETTASFTKFLQIPADISPGKYTVESSLVYPGQTVPAVSSYQFIVEQKIFGIFLSDFIIYALITLVVALILVLISRLIIKKRRANRFSPYEYLSVPPAKRIYYEIISDIIMQMRYRLGDKAVSIAKSVTGLVVDNDGRVLEISAKPALIIASLISKYENLLGQKVSFAFQKFDPKTKASQSQVDKNLLVIRKK